MLRASRPALAEMPFRGARFWRPSAALQLEASRTSTCNRAKFGPYRSMVRASCKGETGMGVEECRGSRLGPQHPATGQGEACGVGTGGGLLLLLLASFASSISMVT